MIDAKGSVGHRPGVSAWRVGWPVVVPDGCGQGEDALQDVDQDAGGGVATVAFGVELAFEDVVDQFDDLAQRFEEPGAGRSASPFAGRAQQADACPGQPGFELVPVVVIVGDDDLPSAADGQGGPARMSSSTWRSSALAPVSAKPTGRLVQRAQQLQPRPPEPAGMAGAVPVFGPSGQ